MTYFFFNDTATTEIYTLSLHDALPISAAVRGITNGLWITWTGASYSARVKMPRTSYGEVNLGKLFSAFKRRSADACAIVYHSCLPGQAGWGIVRLPSIRRAAGLDPLSRPLR